MTTGANKPYCMLRASCEAVYSMLGVSSVSPMRPPPPAACWAPCCVCGPASGMMSPCPAQMQAYSTHTRMLLQHPPPSSTPILGRCWNICGVGPVQQAMLARGTKASKGLEDSVDELISVEMCEFCRSRTTHGQIACTKLLPYPPLPSLSTPCQPTQ
jgi:hypothetical protein